jgi:FMN phosphatase YigB (HAD superfamily)
VSDVRKPDAVRQDDVAPSDSAARGPRDRQAPPRVDQAFDAWLVDLDGTLYDARLIRFIMPVELAILGLSAVPIIRRFRQEHERLREELDQPVDSPFSLQIDRTARALGRSRAQVERQVDRWMIRRPSRWLRLLRRRALLDEIARFREKGGRTAVVSDYPARTKLRAMEADNLFDVVVANGEEGGPPRLKPHPDGLLQAAAALEVAPARCLVLGDREDADGAAARAAGMAFRLIR